MSIARRTILIADDEQMIRNLTADLIASLGFEVIEAEDGEKALELFRQHGERVGLVILDLSMPVKDGAKTFDELRLMDKELKIVLSSGFSDDPSIAHLVKKGAWGVLTKPYRIDELMKTVEEAFKP